MATPKTRLDKGRTDDARFMFMEENVRNLVLSGTWGQEGAFRHYADIEA